MILLTSASDEIRVVTGTAADVDVHASYVDFASGVATPDRKNTLITTATTTDVVLAPAASTTRNVKTLIIRNRDSADATDITVIHFDGTNSVELWKSNLAAGEKLVWSEARGWMQYSAAGAEKTDSPSEVARTLAADQSNATTTPTEVTGLKITGVTPGVYYFRYMLVYQSSVTTTGVKFSVNHDGTVTSFVANMNWVDASATASTATPDQDAVGAAGHVIGAMAARAKSVAGWGTLLGVDTINADMLCIIEGTMTVTVAGELELWHGSETANSTTVKAGSSVILKKVG